MPPFDGHVIKDAPESMQLSMRQPEDQMMAQDLGLLAMRLVMQDQAVDRIVPMIAMARYLGQEQVEGVDCHKLLLRYKTQELSVEGNTQQLPPIDMRLWIEQGDRPLIHKIEPHIKKLLGAMPGTPPGLQQMEVSYTIRLTDYQVNPKIPDARFDYAPPAGSTQSASVQEALEKAQKAQRQAQQAQQQPQAGVQALEGQQAPGFELPKLGADQPVSLAQHKGEHVVVLDFWATWCPPCVEGLPKVEQVTRKFHDQGVRLYAVNLREGADKIRQFLEQQGLDVPVLLDREGAVAELYQVRGIPTTVVIGKDGTVQGVHVGLVPGEQIEKDLQKALAAADKPAE
jgi:peroxiredoxin